MPQTAYLLTLMLVAMSLLSATPFAWATRPNLLVITVDDMNADSVGVFGAALQDTTPNIDGLAARGMRFDKAHVQVANCKPSRNVMWSGRYPHSNRVEGFYPVRNAQYPTLMSVLQDAGYFTAIRNKLADSSPYFPYPWDAVLDQRSGGNKLNPKNPGSYGDSLAEAIGLAEAAGQPFFVMINIADPHLPFYGLDRFGKHFEDSYRPSRVYTPEEVPVPGFLFDDAVVRHDLAHYYSSVRRADDAVGAVLAALAESDEAENTVILFLSDHGMPLPFAKTQLYHHSTHTPLIIRWPGVVNAGAVDDTHLVSAVDLLPTLLDGLGLEIPLGIQGRSFLPLLQGRKQSGRDQVFKAYNENLGGQRAPMRAVQTDRFLYIFNAWSSAPPAEILRPWSFRRFTMWSAAMGTNTFRRMEELGKYDKRLAWRVDLLKHRVPEELYDVETDPDCLHNLAHDPAYAEQLTALRNSLEAWMRNTDDHALKAFHGRDNPALLAAYMQDQAAASRARKRAARQARSDAIVRAMLEQRARQEQPENQGSQAR